MIWFYGPDLFRMREDDISCLRIITFYGGKERRRKASVKIRMREDERNCLHISTFYDGKRMPSSGFFQN